jgi:hypothetical protein
MILKRADKYVRCLDTSQGEKTSSPLLLFELILHPHPRPSKEAFSGVQGCRAVGRNPFIAPFRSKLAIDVSRPTHGRGQGAQ